MGHINAYALVERLRTEASSRYRPVQECAPAVQQRAVLAHGRLDWVCFVVYLAF